MKIMKKIAFTYKKKITNYYLRKAVPSSVFFFFVHSNSRCPIKSLSNNKNSQNFRWNVFFK